MLSAPRQGRHDAEVVSDGRHPSIRTALLLGLVTFALAVGLSATLRQRETRTLEAATEIALEAVVIEVEHRTRDRVLTLERLAADWERRGGLTEEEFEAAAGDLTRDLSFLQAVEWADPSYHVRWIVPLEGNEAARGLDLASEDRRRAALETSRDNGKAALSQPVELVQGGAGFLVYVPLHAGDRFDGFLVGVCRSESLLSGLLRNVAPGFAVRITATGGVLDERPAEAAEWSSARGERLPGALREWSIEVAPGREVIATYRSYTPLAALVSASGFAIVFGVLAQLAGSRRVRNLELAAEVERRQEVEEELSRVVEAIPDHVWSQEITPDGIEPGYYSSVIARITGRPPETFRTSLQAWYDTVHEEDVESLKRAHRELLGGERQSFDIEYRIIAADGTPRWLRERVQARPTERGRRLDGITSDITDMKRAEAERLELEAAVQQSQKLDSLGVLAGGIAHDFNNLLVGVLGNARLALDDLPGDSPVRVPLERIERAANRAADLCRQMLAYAGKASIERQPLDLREAVHEAADLLAASIPKKIDVEYDFDARLPLVEADATQIRQVVLNLVTNAAEAIGDERGTIHVRAARLEASRSDLDALELGHDLEPGGYVALEVADDGCGMTEETRRRFMEPFFTTKFSGRGLGLAAVQGIVRRHQGAIAIDSAPGQGTSIRLLLPALEASAQPRRIEPPVQPRGFGDGTVLLVDDDEAVREFGAAVLERAGFQPLVANDGVEGVAALRRHRSEVVCVVLDLTMPRLDGADALRALRAVREDVPVILCSGYPEETAISPIAGIGVSGFLAKPYRPSQLLDKIDEALAATRTEATG